MKFMKLATLILFLVAMTINASTPAECKDKVTDKDILSFVHRYAAMTMAKSDFETTDAYLKRIAKSGSAGKDFILDIPLGRAVEFSYDSDKEILTLGLVGADQYLFGFPHSDDDNLKDSPLAAKFIIYDQMSEGGAYVGSNAFGVKKVVKKHNEEQVILICTNPDLRFNDRAAPSVTAFAKPGSRKMEQSVRRLDVSKNSQLRMVQIQVSPEGAKKILSKGVCRLHITTDLYKNQKKYVLKWFNHFSPTVTSPSEMSWLFTMFTARLNKVEIINHENNQKYTEFDLNLPVSPIPENNNVTPSDKSNKEKPKLGVYYLPTSVISSSIAAQSNSFRAKPDVAKLLSSIDALGATKGVVIVTLPYSGVGYKQGLRPDDIVLYVDDKEVQGITTGLSDALSNVRHGDKIILTIWRDSHEMKMPIQF